jgi:predicted glycosyltransferase
MNAESALIYGGYNSVVDVLFVEIPTLVVLREMKDQEQQVHVHCLQEKCAGALVSISEDDISADKLQILLLENLNKTISADNGVEMNGAACAANYLYSKLMAS